MNEERRILNRGVDQVGVLGSPELPNVKPSEAPSPFDKWVSKYTLIQRLELEMRLLAAMVGDGLFSPGLKAAISVVDPMYFADKYLNRPGLAPTPRSEIMPNAIGLMADLLNNLLTHNGLQPTQNNERDYAGVVSFCKDLLREVRG